MTSRPCAVSAKQQIGLDDLLDVIGLVADLQDLKANPNREAYGTIIESKVDKGRGNVATVLVQTGTLKVGDIVTVGKTYGRVRALQNAAGRRVKQAEPATAVEILGLQDLPEAGDLLRVVTDEKAARDAAEAVERNAAGSGAASLEDISAQIQASEVKELRVILKTDVQGSLGAIRHALDALSTTETRINILSEAAGDINESDVLLAAASQAVVVGFNTKLDPGAERAVEASGVDVRLYEVIYKLTDDIQLALQGLLTPKLVEQIEGHAEVRQLIKAGKAGHHRRLVRHRRPDGARWPGSPPARRPADRRGADRVAAPVQGRRPRGGGQLRVRHWPVRLARVRRGRRDRVLPDGVGGFRLSQRTDRLDSQIRAELMQIFQREMADPRVGFATVTRVHTSPDLTLAQVWVSVYGPDADQGTTVKALTDAAGWLRHRLGERLTIRKVPRLEFRADDSMASGDAVLRILRDLDTDEASDR